MVIQAVAGGAAIGAGVGVSSVALAPFNAANTFMGSAFFGYGMILGERYMYQADWPKIQQRLENGEQIENIIQEYTGTFTAVVMKEAKIIFETVTREFIAIMAEALRGADAAEPKIEAGAGGVGGGGRPGRGGGVPSAGTINKPTPVPTPPPAVTLPRVLKTMTSFDTKIKEQMVTTMLTQFALVLKIDKAYHQLYDSITGFGLVRQAAFNNLFKEYKKFVVLQSKVINFLKQFGIDFPEKSYIPVFE